MVAVHKAVRAAAPELKPRIIRGMLGYGKCHYRYAGGREGDWFVVGLASQNNHISLYICICEKNQHLPEINKHRLGDVSVGKSCIRFKNLADLDLRVAFARIRKAANLARPGSESLVERCSATWVLSRKSKCFRLREDDGNRGRRARSSTEVVDIAP